MTDRNTAPTTPRSAKAGSAQSSVASDVGVKQRSATDYLTDEDRQEIARLAEQDERERAAHNALPEHAADTYKFTHRRNAEASKLYGPVNCGGCHADITKRREYVLMESRWRKPGEPGQHGVSFHYMCRRCGIAQANKHGRIVSESMVVARLEEEIRKRDVEIARIRRAVAG